MRWILLTIGILSLLLTPGALAQDADVELTFTAPEECDEGSFCFDVDGDIGSIEEGDQVHVTLQNEDNVQHNVFVTEQANASVGSDTPADAAIANSETIESGQETSFTFTAPASGDELYFWCDEIGHEEGGMYVQGEQGADAPAPGLLGLALAGLTAAAIARRR